MKFDNSTSCVILRNGGEVKIQYDFYFVETDSVNLTLFVYDTKAKKYKFGLPQDYEKHTARYICFTCELVNLQLLYDRDIKDFLDRLNAYKVPYLQRLTLTKQDKMTDQQYEAFAAEKKLIPLEDFKQMEREAAKWEN